MMEPSSGKAASAKHAALSMTQSSVPNVMTRPEETRSPEPSRGPAQNETPDAVFSPTVGANCRGISHGSTIRGRWSLSVGTAGRRRRRLCGIGYKHDDVPRFGALSRGNTPTPARVELWMIGLQVCSSSCVLLLLPESSRPELFSARWALASLTNRLGSNPSLGATGLPYIGLAGRLTCGAGCGAGAGWAPLTIALQRSSFMTSATGPGVSRSEHCG